MVKRQPVPMPGTGGGGMTMMKATSIEDRGACAKSAVITAADKPFFRPITSGLLEHRNRAAHYPPGVGSPPEKRRSRRRNDARGIQPPSPYRLEDDIRGARSDAAPGNCAD